MISDAFQKRSDNDFRVEYYSGTGCGGQKRNKTQSCCRVIHVSTSIVEKREGRSRVNNYNDAKDAILKRLDDAERRVRSGIIASDRKEQVGSGMRSDKVLTMRFQDDQVIHHATGKSMSARQYMKGFMDRIW